MKRLTINVGFITNSSSVVHWFPKEILQDAEVKAFIDAYGLGSGSIGSELWHRGACGSFIVTEEQRARANDELQNSEYGTSTLAVGGHDTVTVIYGDEYETVYSELCSVLAEAATRLKLDHHSYDYN